MDDLLKIRPSGSGSGSGSVSYYGCVDEITPESGPEHLRHNQPLERKNQPTAYA
jgi:hypothetical protein